MREIDTETTAALLHNARRADVYEDFEKTARTFRELRAVILQDGLPNNIDASMIGDIQAKWAAYECLSEALHVDALMRATDMEASLVNYELFPHYQRFLEKDIALLGDSLSHTDRPAHFVMIGSGPLPVTSLLFGQWKHGFGCRVTNVDTDEPSLLRGKHFMDGIGAEGQDFVHADGATVKLPKDADAVIIAALAGGNRTEKLAIIKNIAAQLRPGARLSYRHGTGNRQLLYPECTLTADEITSLGLQQTASVRGSKDFFNSIEVFEKCL